MLFRNYLIAAGASLILVGNTAAKDAVEPGSMEGHLKIISLNTVELAEAKVQKGISENYADYPLIILSWDGKKEMARMTADAKGNYHVALPPGDYILDVQGRAPGQIRARPQPFTVVSRQTVRVDMDIDTGIR